MKRFPLPGALLLGGLVLAAAAVLGLQRQATAALRWEAEMRSAQTAELARLRAENARLRAAMPRPAEAQARRTEAAEARRLRAEIATLQAAGRSPKR